MPACRVWLSLPLLFNAYPLLGPYLHTYKHMRLLTRELDNAEAQVKAVKAVIVFFFFYRICTSVVNSGARLYRDCHQS